MRLPWTAEPATMLRVPDRDSSDEQLLLRVAGHYRGAFEELYRRYARTMLGLALRRLRDRGRAEDAVQ